MRLLDLFDLFLIDLDGVVYVSDEAVPGSVDTLKTLNDCGKKIIFLTNNPRHGIEEYRNKLRGMGIGHEPLHIITAGSALASHIKSEFPDLGGKKAYVIGSDALKEAILETGLELVEGEEAKRADFLIFGGHPEFHYNEMKIAAIALSNGAHFYATNRDPAYPTSEGHVPATGAMLASIEVASGKRAVCAGKPEHIIFDMALDDYDRGKAVIVGDHIHTDIKGGKHAGIKTVLVLSGSTNKTDVKDNEVKPDFIIKDLSGLLSEVN